METVSSKPPGRVCEGVWTDEEIEAQRVKDMCPRPRPCPRVDPDPSPLLSVWAGGVTRFTVGQGHLGRCPFSLECPRGPPCGNAVTRSSLGSPQNSGHSGRKQRGAGLLGWERGQQGRSVPHRKDETEEAPGTHPKAVSPVAGDFNPPQGLAMCPGTRVWRRPCLPAFPAAVSGLPAASLLCVGSSSG